ncbi:DNA ligase 1-like [Clytia hemisphaerica]|uniref:DNA ligase 1-like n=1 Tax=Clytia hemisphaerica TaxID=252671 RepID=UPI0034D77788
MIWTKMHEEILCREILTYEPFNYKSGTVQRGEAWKLIAESLNSHDNPKFSVSHRGVRERYAVLERNFKQKIAAEEKATGISPDEPTDLEKALEEIVQKFKDIELTDSSKKVSEEKERQTAADMRQQCMETFRESEKRKGDEGSTDKENGKRRRRSGNDTIAYLREKMESDKELKERELNIAQLREENLQRMMLQQQEQNQTMLNLLMQMQNSNQKKN